MPSLPTLTPRGGAVPHPRAALLWWGRLNPDLSSRLRDPELFCRVFRGSGTPLTGLHASIWPLRSLPALESSSGLPGPGLLWVGPGRG